MTIFFQKHIFSAFGLFYLCLTASVQAGNLTTLQITASTISAVTNYLHYKVIGICFWQEYNASDCTVTTTPKVENYLPDAVVSVYH